MKLQTDDFISDLERWFDAYNNKMVASSYSKNTIELYSRVINQFIEYSLGYQDEMQLTDIRSMYFDGYIRFAEEEAKRRGKKIKHGSYLQKSTKNTYFKALKGYFNFISDNNDELYSFDRFIKKLRVPDSSKKEENLEYLTDEEVERLFHKIHNDKRKKENFISYRDSFLANLLLYAGLRISESLRITLDCFSNADDEPDMYLIEIYGKGGKEQVGYIAKSIINEDINFFRDVLKYEGNEPIMKTKSGKLLDRVSAWKSFRTKYKAVHIKKQGLHLLRHTCAMKLTKNGEDLTVVKKILRHSSITTTTIYSKATTDMVARALLKK